ncbi:MAG: hypothetical protein FJ225_03685 [Lentisphaerae bacterium]|nr:hypothetical protein [Lentisphaerota bacterium]
MRHLERRWLALTAGAAANLPWIAVWGHAALNPERLHTHVPVLFMLLALGISAAVALPCLIVSGLLVRRWFLIAMLSFVNVYWPLRWIELHAAGGYGFPGRQAGLTVYLALMFVSSAAAGAVYWIADRALTAFRKRLRLR